MRETNPVTHLQQQKHKSQKIQKHHVQRFRIISERDVEKRAGEGRRPVEGASVHGSLIILQRPQMEEALCEPRVRSVQTRAPDALTEMHGPLRCTVT